MFSNFPRIAMPILKAKNMPIKKSDQGHRIIIKYDIGVKDYYFTFT
jgi:hypothetical protein